jgi:hypothetical protein
MAGIASCYRTPMIHGTQLLRPDPHTPLDEGKGEQLFALPYFIDLWLVC